MHACGEACSLDLNETTNSTGRTLNTFGFSGSCLRVKFNKTVMNSRGNGIHIPSLEEVTIGARSYVLDLIPANFD